MIDGYVHHSTDHPIHASIPDTSLAHPYTLLLLITRNILGAESPGSTTKVTHVGQRGVPYTSAHTFA